MPSVPITLKIVTRFDTFIGIYAYIMLTHAALWKINLKPRRLALVAQARSLQFHLSFHGPDHVRVAKQYQAKPEAAEFSKWSENKRGIYGLAAVFEPFDLDDESQWPDARKWIVEQIERAKNWSIVRRQPLLAA